MGHKISPVSLRIGINRGWASRWFGGLKYRTYLKDDLGLRDFLTKRFKNMSVDHIDIERGTDVLRIVIHTARPGLIIGRGGAGIEELKQKIALQFKSKLSIRIEIQEIKSPESSAAIMAESIVDQVAKRIPFRRVIKQTLAKIMAHREVKGAKIQMSGRLDGAEIARVEHLEDGSLPLQTLRAHIDFAKATALTTYGTIGVKVWIYQGEIFEE